MPYMSHMQCTTGSLLHSWPQPSAMVCACPQLLPSSGWWQSGWGGCPTASHESTRLKLPLATRTHTETQRLPGSLQCTISNPNKYNSFCTFTMWGSQGTWSCQGTSQNQAVAVSMNVPLTTPELSFQIPVTSQVTLLQTEKLSAKLKCIHKHRI